MPHKDREARLAYLRAWKEKRRPSPAAESQPDHDLPSRGIVAFSVDGTKVQCHTCGRWFKSMNTHTKGAHGMTLAEYKETYDLARTASMWPPALKEKQREAALARDQGAIGRANIPPAIGRKAGAANRLSVRIDASEARKGIHTRGGGKTR